MYLKIIQFEKPIYVFNFDLKAVRVGLTWSYFTRKFVPEKKYRVCKGVITKCSVFGSGKSEEVIFLGARAIA